VLVWRSLADVPVNIGASVVTIGNFDGVHLGHRHVIARARELADELGGATVVAVTFDPHPMQVLLPERAPQPLTSVDRRVGLLAEAGADAVLVLPFTEAIAQLPAENFVTDILLGCLRAVGVVVGENFRFGHRAQGDVKLLANMCENRHVRVVALPLDGSGEHTWSSTYVRNALAEGDVSAAAEALGRPYAVVGRVVRGHQRGRQLGYPTANVPVALSATAVPADGVYAGWLRRLDEPGAPYLPAAISVGSNPTFGDDVRHVESYVLDRTDLELYDVTVEVSFVQRLRGQVKFDSVEDLLAQVKFDVDAARTLLHTPSPG
jgi:riboflavin kinase/FMN adenylyltransferase